MGKLMLFLTQYHTVLNFKLFTTLGKELVGKGEIPVAGETYYLAY